MVVYYNVQNIPKQEYRIIGHLEQSRWTGKAMIEHAMKPWTTPKKEISSYEIEGADGTKFRVDADVLKRGFSNHLINITNARISGNEIVYNR